MFLCLIFMIQIIVTQTFNFSFYDFKKMSKIVSFLKSETDICNYPKKDLQLIDV